MLGKVCVGVCLCGRGYHGYTAVHDVGCVCVCVFRALSMVGLMLIALGTGGIKPCVAAFGGDQFEEHQVRCFRLNELGEGGANSGLDSVCLDYTRLSCVRDGPHSN